MVASTECDVPPMTPSINGLSNSTALRARNIFFNNLPFSWVPLEGSSYDETCQDIEIFEQGKSTGVILTVKIKGTTTLTGNGDNINLSIAVDHLKYFCDEMNKPVLLTLVDVKKQQVFWLLAQHYVHTVLEASSPNWRDKKTVTLKIPLACEISSSWDLLWKNILQSLEFIYFKQYHTPFRIISSRIQSYLNSPGQLEFALKREIEKQFKRQSQVKEQCSSKECSSCQDNGQDDESAIQADDYIQDRLEYAQQRKLLDPKENRTAYYCIRDALDMAGLNATTGVRCTALGEMFFYDYLLHFMRVFDANNIQTYLCLTKLEEHLRYFQAAQELTNVISSALDEGEILAASMLVIRLADTFLFAVPYISKTFGQEQASPLLDYAQTLLVLAHEMASMVEAPGRMLQ